MDANSLKVGSKVGYINPKTGRYTYSEVTQTGILHPKTGNPAIELTQTVRQGKYHTWKNVFHDEIEAIDRWSKEQSIDVKGKTLLKLIA